MKKRILAAVLSICMLVSCFAFASAASAEGETYSLKSSYSTKQGPEWYYMYNKNGSGWKNLVYYAPYSDGGKSPNWQTSSNPEGSGVYYSFCIWDGVNVQAGKNGNGDTYQIAAVFKAPKAGTLKINPWDYSCFTEPGTAYSGAYKARISLNESKVLYNGTLTQATRSGEITVDVKAGDMIYFVVDPNGNDGATTKMDSVSVTYLETAGTAEPEDSSSGETTVEPVEPVDLSYWEDASLPIEIETKASFMVDPVLFSTAKNTGKNIIVTGIGVDAALDEYMQYKWEFDGSAITLPDITMAVGVDTSAFEKGGVKVAFDHYGALPGPANLTLNVRSVYESDEVSLYVYAMDAEGGYTAIAKDLVPISGNITFSLTECQTLIISDQVL